MTIPFCERHQQGLKRGLYFLCFDDTILPYLLLIRQYGLNQRSLAAPAKTRSGIFQGNPAYGEKILKVILQKDKVDRASSLRKAFQYKKRRNIFSSCVVPFHAAKQGSPTGLDFGDQNPLIFIPGYYPCGRRPVWTMFTFYIHEDMHNKYAVECCIQRDSHMQPRYENPDSQNIHSPQLLFSIPRKRNNPSRQCFPFRIISTTFLYSCVHAATFRPVALTVHSVYPAFLRTFPVQTSIHTVYHHSHN